MNIIGLIIIDKLFDARTMKSMKKRHATDGTSSTKPVSRRHRSYAAVRIPILIAISLIVVVAAGSWWLWHNATSTATADAAAANNTVAVERGNVEKSVESSGSISANLEVEIKCRASGEVITLPFDVSDLVTAGDLLCQLDPTDEQLNVKSSQASLDQTQAQLIQAKVALQQAELALKTTRKQTIAQLESSQVQLKVSESKLLRQRKLVEQKLGSQEELETYEAQVALNRADVASAQASVEEVDQLEVALESKRQDVAISEADLVSRKLNLETQQRQLDYTTVNAPITGYVSSLDVQKGSIVASGTSNVSGGTTIMTLMDLSKIFILATVDESDIGGVIVGQNARVKVDSFPSQTFEGRVVRIAVQGVEESKVVTFEVKVEIVDDEKHLLKPLMTGNVTLVLQQRDDVLVVPQGAISRRGDGAYVTLADGSEKKIVIGVEGLENVEVIEGLNQGDIVQVNAAFIDSRWSNQKNSSRGPRMM